MSTWIQAIEKGFYATWPGLTVQAVRRHLPKSIITTTGHLDQQRKNKQSTKEKVVTDEMSPTPTPPPPIGTSRTQQVYAECLSITGKIFSDLPGRFVVPSSRGNNYLLIVYDSTAMLSKHNLTLNLLRASRINPQLSAHAQLITWSIRLQSNTHVAHEKHSVRESWAPHGAPSWYISPATEHYRCYKVYVIETGAERITDTLEWFPAHVPMPKTASIDAVLAAARELISALQNPAPATPFAGIDDTKLAALQKDDLHKDSTIRTSKALTPSTSYRTQPYLPDEEPRMLASWSISARKRPNHTAYE